MMDSFKKRYGYKLLTNSFGFGFSMVTQALVSRGLGPIGYGDYSFLTNFFSQLISFFEMGTSTCFYTKLSQRHKDSELIKFFFYFSFLVAIALAVFVIAALFLPVYRFFWPGQTKNYIILAAGLCLFLWGVQVLNSMLDALGITVSGEKAKILQKVLIVFGVAFFFFAGRLSLQNFFCIQYTAVFFLGVSFILLLRRSGYMPKDLRPLDLSHTREYAQEFYHYTHPLFVYSLIGVILNMVDRWLLQIFSGSAEQGFFGFSLQIGSICFLFTSAVTPLLTREFSIAHARKDTAFMQQFLKRYFPLFFIMAAFLSCFIAVESKAVIILMGGNKFESAFWPMAIMAFYPVYQTYGQLTGSVFFATAETKMYRNLGITFLLIGLPLSYLLLAPRSQFGFSAGAAGLAVKMVLIQVIGVNVSLFYICKILKVKFFAFVTQQAKILGTFVLLSYMAMWAVNSIGFPKSRIMLNLIFSGVFYSVLTATTLYFFPAAGGMDRADLTFILQKIPGNIFKKKSYNVRL